MNLHRARVHRNHGRPRPNGFTGRAQNLPPPFTPRRERASGKALAFTGCVDTHSAAISIANLVAQSKLVADAAVMPILAGLTTNTVVKIIVSFSLGGRQFGWRLFPGLLIFALAPWAAVLAKRLPLFEP